MNCQLSFCQSTWAKLAFDRLAGSRIPKWQERLSRRQKTIIWVLRYHYPNGTDRPHRFPPVAGEVCRLGRSRPVNGRTSFMPQSPVPVFEVADEISPETSVVVILQIAENGFGPRAAALDANMGGIMSRACTGPAALSQSGDCIDVIAPAAAPARRVRRSCGRLSSWRRS